MHGLVYIFIALAALGIGATAYFGLTFTPIEALVTAICAGTLFVLAMERALRRRAEARLEKAIEDLSRLLSTDAQAGSVLSQRVNAIVDIDAGARLEAVEADVSVLGTVVRQVAEAVAELEEDRRRRETGAAPPAPPPPAPVAAAPLPVEPRLPAAELRRTIEAGSLVFHIDPVVQLPARRPHGYDLVPRIALADGSMLAPHDFMPRRGHEDVHRRIDAMMLDEAVVIARRARTAGQPTRLNAFLSRATLSDSGAVDNLLGVLDANRAIADMLAFRLTHADWKLLTGNRRALVGTLSRKGVGFVLAAADSLRLDFPELAGYGFNGLRVDAHRFVSDPESLSDFHAGDIAAFTRRYGIELCATGLSSEQQLLSLLEDGITLVQGPHLAEPGPVRADLTVERPRPAQPRRVEA